MDKYYIYGKLNKETIIKQYTGIPTNTANTNINNATSTISVDVIKVPHKLSVKEAGNLFTNYDGSEDIIVDLTPYAKQDIVPNYATISATETHQNNLIFWRKDGNTETELFRVEISPFIQVQSDLGQSNSTAESYVRNKETKYLLNNGSDGTDVYTEKNYVDTQDSNLKDYVDNADNNLQNEIGNLQNLSTTNKSNLVSAINENKSNLDNESLTRANNDNALQDQIGTLSNLETTNKTTLVDAINENKGSIDTHIADTSNPHSVTKDQVGLGNVDNTSDLDKSISIATQNALDLKLDKSNTNQTISKNITLARDISQEPDPDYLALQETQINLNTQATDSNTYVFDLADSDKSGLMSSQDVQTLSNLVERVNSIEGKTTRLLYSASQNPSASDINTFVTSLGYTSPFEGIAVVISGTYHIWHYYENNSIGWRDDGQDTVSTFTNSNAGIILGTNSDGKIYAESNGTGSVYGWSDLKGRVSDAENNITSLQNNKVDKTTTINNKALSSNITLIPSDIGAQSAITNANKLSADLIDDTSTANKFVTTSEKNIWNSKQDALVSGTNIKSINNQSILGSGNLTISGDVTDVILDGNSIVADTIAEIPSVETTLLDIDTSVTNNSGNLITSGGVYNYCQEISYLTTAPDSDNTSGRLKLVVLTSEPATRYDGYIYFITEA